MSKGVKVQVLRHHSFAGKEYQPGDSYSVSGDAHQTTEQYVDTLRGSGLARPADEDGPNVVDEVGSPDAAAPKSAASSEVKPLSTDNIAEEPAQPAAKAKAKAAKPRAARAAKPGKKQR